MIIHANISRIDPDTPDNLDTPEALDTLIQLNYSITLRA
jgi:hypothetical protein